ncbi:unnamed protein product [Fraxinus pennsylvanica]|uniref:PPM-type phosphatase domain-containing protein n=1 Tax=Fraxinus pennsylvanica TaxID=56036 RepID=A0AAD2DYL0_9LAMI|nr:unnamed protein product [Fraxinus pennsylvanica]
MTGHGGSRAAEFLKEHLFKNLLKHPEFTTNIKLAITNPLSDDIKPNRIDERKRIECAGGVVMWAGTWRVGGVLAMSRAFGNRLLKKFVVAEPEIQDQEVDQDLELLVLASDGLWDVDAISLAQTEDPEAAARKLVETAFTRGGADNITCIVVKFHHNKKEPDGAHQNCRDLVETQQNCKAGLNETKQNCKAGPEETERNCEVAPDETQQR